MMKHLLTIPTDLLRLFYPPQCLLCKRPLVAGEQQLCAHCLCDLPRVRPGIGNHKGMVNQLLGWQEHLLQSVAFLYYQKEGNVQRLVHAFKYYGNRELAFYLGQLAAQELSANGHLPDGVDALVPVPLHYWRKWRRGYNQSEWIARGVQSVNPIPIHRNCLKRVRYTATQTRKSVYNRSINMEHTFQVTDPAAYAGQHLLLIDDVITTGDTIGSCIDALSIIPDVRISVLALSIV